ncbi:hypothetical protein HMPREF3202_01224 [Prevotella bivia]|uniref:Uncharacterized protein n=1 Tax=Prevotella bivia TaxID=28125 RepID=A0A137SXV6_9BACT|nr:hypothetical protein HMPREF3202_01224 [Prevotella bivia]
MPIFQPYTNAKTKHDLLRLKRLCFTLQKVTFCTVKDNLL